MTKKLPRVSIIILTTNALAMTKEQLIDIAKLEVNGLDCECMVVDNGSGDGTEEALCDYKLPNMDFKFIQSGANLGFAGGNNVGIKDAVKRGFDYIILMNNDLILPKDIVTKLVDYMEENPDVGASSPKMYFAKGYEFLKGKYKESELGKVIWYAGGKIDRKNAYSSHRGVDEVDHGQFDKVTDTDFANGATVIVRKEVFEKIGYLNSDFFYFNNEDSEIAIRAVANGFEYARAPQAKIFHEPAVWSVKALIRSARNGAVWPKLKKLYPNHYLHFQPKVLGGLVVLPWDYLYILTMPICVPVLLVRYLAHGKRDLKIFFTKWPILLLLRRYYIWKEALKNRVWMF